MQQDLAIIEHIIEQHPNASSIIGGDFNARVGNLGATDEDMQLYCPAYRNASDKTINKRGEELLDFMTQHDLILANGRFQGDEEGKFTFHSQQGKAPLISFSLTQP